MAKEMGMGAGIDLSAIKKVPLGRRVAEGPKMKTKKEKRDESATFSSQLQTLAEFIENPDNSDYYNYSQLLSAVQGLASFLNKKVPAKLQKLIDAAGPDDSFDVDDVSNWLEEQAGLAKMSVLEMIDVLKKDENPEIQKQALDGEKVLERREMMIQAKPQLRELAVQLLQQAKTNQDQELKMTDAEIEDYESKFRVVEQKDLDYETYVRALATKYVERLEAQNLQAINDKKDVEELMAREIQYWHYEPQANSFMYTYKGAQHHSWKGGKENFQEKMQKELERLEKEKMVRGFSATEFFESAKVFADEQYKDDEAKKRDFLARVAGVAQPLMPLLTVNLDRDSGVAVIDKSFVTEFGADGLPLLEKALEAKLLSGITCDPSGNSPSASKVKNHTTIGRYYSFMAGLRAFDFESAREQIKDGSMEDKNLYLEDGAVAVYQRDQYSSHYYGNSEESKAAVTRVEKLDKGIQEVILDKPDILSKVETVIRTEGGDKDNHSPLYTYDNVSNRSYKTYSLTADPQRVAPRIPLSENDGVFYEDPAQFATRKKEIEAYEKKLSTYLSEHKAPEAKVIPVTREDIRIENANAMDAARQTYLGIQAATDAALASTGDAIRLLESIRAEQDQVAVAEGRQVPVRTREKADTSDIVGRTRELSDAMKEMTGYLRAAQLKIGNLERNGRDTDTALEDTKTSLALYDQRAKNVSEILRRGQDAGQMGRKAVIEEAAQAVWNLPQSK